MKDRVQIREYVDSDKEQLIAVLKLNIPQYFAPSELQDFEDYLENSIEQYFIAQIGKQLIGGGGINFEEASSTGKISWDVIHPSFQRMGVGTKLLAHRLETIKTLETIKIIEVRTSQHAHQFYERNGFVLDQVVQDYWAMGYDLYAMTYEDKNGQS